MKTSFYSLLCIVIRVAALAVSLRVLVELPGHFVYFATNPTQTSFVVATFATQGAIVAICLALWMFPGALATLAVTRAAREPFESSVDATDLQRIGFGVVGVWFALNGAADALYALGRIFAIRHELGELGTAAPYPWVDLGTGIAIVAMGVALTLGSRGLARFLHALRYASPAPRPSEETP